MPKNLKKAALTIAVSLVSIHVCAAPLDGSIPKLGNMLEGTNQRSVTDGNNGQSGGEDRNREDLSIRVVDAGGTVAGAACTLSNAKGDWSITAPDTVTVRRSDSDLKIRCEKPGYDPTETTVKASTTQIMPKHFRFSADPSDDAMITVPYYDPAITVTLNAKVAAQ